MFYIVLMNQTCSFSTPRSPSTNVRKLPAVALRSNMLTVDPSFDQRCGAILPSQRPQHDPIHPTGFQEGYCIWLVVWKIIIFNR